MPRIAKQLTDIALRRLGPGTHAVGGQPGLLLRIRESGTRSWVLRIHVGGRRTEFGLGSYPAISLAKARELAAADREAVVRDGRNPAADRREARAALAEAAKTTITVAEAIDLCFEAKRPGFKGEKNAKRWNGTLATHVRPKLGTRTVESLTTTDIADLLLPLWVTQNETAAKVRERLEAVIDWTIAHERVPSGFENPARWRGNLVFVMPKVRAQGGGHQPSVQWREAPSWYSAVCKMPGTGALALRFLALTAVRSGEVTDMTDAELDVDAGLWVIPAERTKTGKRHVVPLSKAALALIEAAPRQAGSPFVFPAPRGGAFSNMALSAVMRRMQAAATKGGNLGWLDEVSKRPAVPHGLRSTFRTWAAEASYDPHLAEIALGHNVGNAVQRAYDRSEMIEKRRAMMEDYTEYLTTSPEAR